MQDQLRELNFNEVQQAIDRLDRTFAKRLENNTDLTESKANKYLKDLQAQLDNANAIQANYNKKSYYEIRRNMMLALKI